jgi:acetyl esterase/lipase
MKMPSFTLFLSLSLVLSAQWSARGQTGAERLSEILKRFPEADQNKDGVLDKSEARDFNRRRNENLLKRFPQADSNRDGQLDQEEIRAFSQKRKQQNEEMGKTNQAPAPDYADISYGEHPLKAFDLWLAPPAKEGSATPLCIFIHGGGFQGGDKSHVQGAIIQRFLDSGVSFVSMNYRLTNGGEFPYPIPMMDAARGLQTLRCRASEWNLDPRRIVCYGGSAGAGISLWLALRDELGDPGNDDPVTRQSTRIIAAGSIGGQSTYDMRVFRKWFGVPNLPCHSALPAFYAMRDGEAADSPRVIALAEDASPINHLSPDDPPIFLSYGRPNHPVTFETPQSDWVHHPLLGIKLKEAMEALDIECIVTGPGIEDDRYQDIYDFLIKKLTASP